MEDQDEDIISVLADKYGREILSLLTTNELSAQQMSTRLDIPVSTTYRKIKSLEDLNLIKKTKVIRTHEGLNESYYKSLVSEIDIKFKDGKISYHVERIKMDDKIIRLWHKFSEK
ncbi:MAG TPA: helix-turn-helix domain-containing protein [Candidatus Nitrosotalea sp.]|jgi:predicted transcriptional regulator|nr:helix-turn-helix domain-containing protein [Candidatus Nitrosotalea sp.]HEU5487471.1 helix-turn-helix domain-containing protein [Candidatus Nitrosotalea sp.]